MLAIIISIWLLSTISFLVGLVIGTKMSPSLVTDIEKGIRRRLDKTPVGPIYRPTQQQIEENRDPRVRESKQEVKKFFDKELGNDNS